MRFPFFQPRVVPETTLSRAEGCDHRRRCGAWRREHPCRNRGAVLLEVILALTLFVAAAAVLGVALSTAMDGVERQRLNTHAANLANTVLSEVQLGIRTASEPGPVGFPAPYQGWTAEILQTPTETELGEASGSALIEVVIRHQNPPMTHRLGQVLPVRSLRSRETPLAIQ